jgi:hypothetical protein
MGGEDIMAIRDPADNHAVDPRAGRGIAKVTAAIFRKCRDLKTVSSVVTATMVPA